MSGFRVLVVIAVLAGCSDRPLPADRAAVPPGPGQGGQGGDAGGGCGSGDPRLELVGAPLLVLDTPPQNGELYPALLWTGDQYLFVWRIANSGTDILMQRIDAAGEGVGGNIRLRPYEDTCDVVWGGSRLAAAWTRKSGSQRQLMFQTFDALGRPLIDEVIVRPSVRVPFDGPVNYGPRIVAISGGFALAWYEEQVFIATVDLDGTVLRAPVAAGGDDLAELPQISLAAGADRILVGWTALQPIPRPPPLQPVNAVFARAFSTELAPSGAAILLDDQAYLSGMQVLATGTGFSALWAHGMRPDNAGVRVAQLDENGTGAAIGALTPAAVGGFYDLAPVAWNDDHLVVLWDDWPASESALTLARHAPDGARQGPPIILPAAGPATRLYTTAHDRTVGFIWSEQAGGAYQVYFQQARACP